MVMTLAEYNPKLKLEGIGYLNNNSIGSTLKDKNTFLAQNISISNTSLSCRGNANTCKELLASSFSEVVRGNDKSILGVAVCVESKYIAILEEVINDFEKKYMKLNNKSIFIELKEDVYGIAIPRRWYRFPLVYYLFLSMLRKHYLQQTLKDQITLRALSALRGQSENGYETSNTRVKFITDFIEDYIKLKGFDSVFCASSMSLNSWKKGSNGPEHFLQVLTNFRYRDLIDPDTVKLFKKIDSKNISETYGVTENFQHDTIVAIGKYIREEDKCLSSYL